MHYVYGVMLIPECSCKQHLGQLGFAHRHFHHRFFRKKDKDERAKVAKWRKIMAKMVRKSMMRVASKNIEYIV